MPYPDPDEANLVSSTQASIAKEPGASSPASPSSSTPSFTIKTDGDKETFLRDIMDKDDSSDDLMDDEYYMFAGECSADMDIDGPTDAALAGDSIDPLDIVYSNIPDRTHILKHAANCDHCGAKKFEYETKGFCCRNGQIQLADPDPEPIPELMRLWSSADADSRHFRDSIRFFNGHFSFTTLGVSLDNNYTNMRSGVYTFRAHGTMYHNVHSFGVGSKPEHLQLYFYDDDPNLSHRNEATKNLDQDVVKKVANIMRGNPYSQTFRSLGDHAGSLAEYRIDLNTDKKLDQRTYNTPIASEVAAIWVEGTDLARRFERSITLYGDNDERYGIQATHGCYDPLSYPLFFPKGQLGWHPNIPKRGVNWELGQQSRDDDDSEETGNRLCVSVRDYYCYRLQTRPAIFNPILHGARLFQQYAVDMYIKIEGTRLNWFREHQPQIRAELYKGVVDSIAAGETRASEVGKRTVLPWSFQGGDRCMKRRHMDAMALVQKYGKPDIFLTMTCNPNWEEIINELFPGQTPQDRPDLVVRVFKAKLQAMKDMLFKEHILGVVIAYVYVVEFQKRGLPHAHFLLIMDSKYKLTMPEQYDCLISAELPDKNKYPELYTMVVKHMMHGPCGVLKPNNICMKDGLCKNRYPRPFNSTTIQGKDSYPVYHRRDNGHNAHVRGQTLDNRWVVPYNPYLLRMFNCHINVEVCSSIKAVKYIYKYIYKGGDQTSMNFEQPDNNGNIDEIKRYIDARWITPPEALWRIFGFNLYDNSPSVLQLPLHLPGMHMVSFNAKDDLRDIATREKASKSMLTEYFEANKKYEKAGTILYKEFPEWFTWQAGDKYWKERKIRPQVGRIVSTHPAEGDRYYLRVLLKHVAGSTSFENMRTVEGNLCETFREAAEKRGLIEADNALDECLTEAEQFAMPSSLRRLFATILVFCEPSDPRGLWDRHLEGMSDDHRRSITCPIAVEQKVLLDIRSMLQSMGKEITSFPLPKMDETYDDTGGEAREIIEESSIAVDIEDASLASSLNPERRSAYDEILAAVDSGTGGVFFVDGPGGTGKTFMYRALLAKLRGEEKIAVATATAGIAASIMPGGRTAHSRFKIPLNIVDGASCNFTKQSGTAKLLRMASLIIWDEATMTKRQAIEALDNSMRDIMGRRDRPFGGKTVVFGGDFRQVLPVVRKGTRGQIIDASLRSSYLWERTRHLKLVTNMRAHSDPWFADFLLRVGNGTEEADGEGNIRLPEDVCVTSTDKESDIERLIDHVFPALNTSMTDPNYITSRAILTTKNDNVDNINMRMIERFNGEERIYHSFDSAEDDPHGYYPPEFLNTLTPNGLPPHVLKLKINCPVILLRNIDPANGLCNGTRLIVRGFQKNAIDAEIVLGQQAGKRVFLPRIPLCPSDDEMFPFRFKRKQFPVRLSFAMTINKAQGQTIPIVSVYLPEPVFSHGQLYVALSRATARRNIKILAVKNDENAKKSQKSKPKKQKTTLVSTTKNIVYKEVLNA
ncbi:uncharacterized protein LOC100832196 [Brachypodium distachyon]|uniref:uncharacterized protein LOC100832196 n=1 Tax=Brachypodium distachyon TaxID=15368 RepID=UPI00052FF6A9|nr:uncharacterized protein LOC100832196 [Brachypodium distachyon]|eukprot:XP_010229584.1 uncharacterized protein LOC100832196 [Brachypodium distachyon]